MSCRVVSYCALTVEWAACAAPLLTGVLVGKRKHGSASVASDTQLCALHTTDGQRFVVRATVKGRLLEVNERLVDSRAEAAGAVAGSSGLLERDSEWGGYVAVVLMDKPQLYDLLDRTDSRLATAEEWKLSRASEATAAEQVR